MNSDAHTGAYSAEEIQSWDQRTSMRPAPYRFAMARPAKGLNVADPLMARVPTSELVCHGKTSPNLPRDPEPDWVDWDLVERGQAVWKEQVARSFAGLGLALLSGFSIARFAEILFVNGYAKSGETAMQRYRATGFYVTDFYRSSLRDPKSKARRGIANVRAMHEWARRRSKKIFDQTKGEGVALCQLDMAEVQLGFSGICMEIIERDFGAGPISQEDAEAMAHCWRLIGYHLGIMDEYNVCRSLEDLRACVDDFMAFTPRRFQTMRPATAELRRTAMEGFGMETGLGTGFWHGLFLTYLHSAQYDLKQLTPEVVVHPGMGIVAHLYIQLFRFDTISAVMGRILLADRDAYEKDPDTAKRKAALRKSLARFHDVFVWRFTGMLYILRHLLLVLGLWRILRRAWRARLSFRQR
ncbi:Hypothetical Protein FCC1311_102042 [Hondaea fermentalgiana]|uniref:Uncharacterized protein n=1 Tax=Hondaea fermentalgiana TaxID=2315210 RepID=A0A2R5GZR9_9STRA|nr:Hypothetical Protein FCC1311_102042 [Hondaea fermentalgiana]|eukprot:GBG33981.1 Hypothetical Protein FCC1311_102042 [Hondaea fermentalgiana]